MLFILHGYQVFVTMLCKGFKKNTQDNVFREKVDKKLKKKKNRKKRKKKKSLTVKTIVHF